MEDIRPYSSEDVERDAPAENPPEWEAARFETDDEEVPFHVPRD